MEQAQAEFSEIDKTILPWLGKTMKALDFFIADAFEQHGMSLTKAQMILLRRLTVNNGLPQNDLAFITNRDKTSLTRLIHTMEKKDLVMRKSSPSDKRSNLVYITEFGRETLKKAYPVLNKLIQSAQKNIDINDLKTAIDVLKQLSININADQLTAPLTNTK